MGEAEIIPAKKQLIIHASLFFYGNAATQNLSVQIAADIEQHWNEAGGHTFIRQRMYEVLFRIKGQHTPQLTPFMIYENTNPVNNYFRIENESPVEVSFVDGIGCNTGYFKLSNLLDKSTTAAHEFGHSIGLQHPNTLDIRGKGTPGIMYPRGTIVDQPFQYNPFAKLGEPGSTINPFTRKVLQKDIEHLHLQQLNFNQKGLAVVGDFTSVWHQAFTF